VVAKHALQSLFIIAHNAVPLIGVVFYGWSIATTLVVFWAETLVNGTANAARIYAHRCWTRKRGHFRQHQRDPGKKALAGEPVEHGSFLLSYVVVLYPLTLAHGLFLVGFLAILSQNATAASASSWWVDFADLRKGLVTIGLLAALECLVDLTNIAHKPFSWLKKRVDRSLGRVLILHLGLLGGAVLLVKFETPVTFLAVIVLLKTLLELVASNAESPLPTEPPRWFVFAAKKTGRDASEEWAQVLADETRQSEEDEMVLESA
jgi:hypothetical protein